MRQDDPRSVSPEGDNQSCRGNEMMESRPAESSPPTAPPSGWQGKLHLVYTFGAGSGGRFIPPDQKEPASPTY